MLKATVETADGKEDRSRLKMSLCLGGDPGGDLPHLSTEESNGGLGRLSNSSFSRRQICVQYYLIHHSGSNLFILLTIPYQMEGLPPLSVICDTGTSIL